MKEANSYEGELKLEERIYILVKGKNSMDGAGTKKPIDGTSGNGSTQSKEEKGPGGESTRRGTV